MVVCGITGCIYLPTFELSKTGKDFRGMVGDTSSRKPIRPDAITRASVVQLLGPPGDTGSDGTIAYYLRTNHGFWILSLPPSVVRRDVWYQLVLSFDADDRLKDYRISRELVGDDLLIRGPPPYRGQNPFRR